jgi:hypothetical protein
MSDNTRHCYMCCQTVEAVATPTGWLHCPRCGANIGFDPPKASPHQFYVYSPPLVVEEDDVTFKGQELPPLHHKPAPLTPFGESLQQQAVAWNQPPVCHTTNPKTLMGRQKLSMLSVVPPASIICEAEAMHYGAFEAPRKDGKKGYGPYNWRDDPVEMMIYIDAALRHLLALVDGEELDRDSGKPHLGHAKACLGIIADAQENGTLIDDRPAVRKGAASSMLAIWKKLQSLTGEPT